MTWVRLDDAWTDRPVFESLPYEVRWHYLSLVVFCSRTARYDGVVREADARRCSDVPDPDAAVAELLNVGLLVRQGSGYRLPLIAEHVPPPHMRDEERKAAQRQRKQRQRLHARDDHSLCQDDCRHMEVSPEVTRDVPRDIGTGQDGTGREGEQDSSAWPPVRQAAVIEQPEDDEEEWAAAWAAQS